jgi:hypothetical protein
LTKTPLVVPSKKRFSPCVEARDINMVFTQVDRDGIVSFDR